MIPVWYYVLNSNMKGDEMTEYVCSDELQDDEYVDPFDTDNHCFKCGEKKDTVEEQYSFGVYAGRMCRECAINGYRDHCGLLDGEQGDYRILEAEGEVYWEDDY